MMLYDCHIHTKRSHDSAAEPSAVCEAALKKGLSGVTFTDHCDCEFCGSQDIFLQFDLCAQDHTETKKQYGERLETLFGIELGDPLFDPVFAGKITHNYVFDEVILSVHAARVPGHTEPFSRIDFGEVPDDFIDLYLKTYFDDTLASVRTFDYDVLAHLTVPLRYIICKYRRTVSIAPYMDTIRDIFAEVIARDKTLEINTSSVFLTDGFLMPDEDLIDLYLSMGGRFFALGSDAHVPGNVGVGFDNAIRLLRNKGIKNLCRYRNRQRQEYVIG